MRLLKNKIKEKIFPSIPFLLHEASILTEKNKHLEHDILLLNNNKQHLEKEISSLSEKIKHLELEVKTTTEINTRIQSQINHLERIYIDDDIAIESSWRTYGSQFISNDKIIDSLHSPYLWDRKRPEYWLILFSVLIERKMESVVDFFIDKYLDKHDIAIAGRYFLVSTYLYDRHKHQNNNDINISAFVFRNLSNNIKNNVIEKYFKGKRVAIVGNGSSGIGLGKGDYIDSFDVVVRFNNYKTESFETDYGNRTDVWVRGSGGDDIVDRAEISNYDLIILEADYEHFPVHFNDLYSIERYIKEDNVECCNFDFGSHLKLRMESGIDFPTTGLVTLWTIINIVGKENVALFGFSFLESEPQWINSHYFNDRDDHESAMRTSAHNMEKEAHFIKKFIS